MPITKRANASCPISSPNASMSPNLDAMCASTSRHARSVPSANSVSSHTARKPVSPSRTSKSNSDENSSPLLQSTARGAFFFSHSDMAAPGLPPHGMSIPRGTAPHHDAPPHTLRLHPPRRPRVSGSPCHSSLSGGLARRPDAIPHKNSIRSDVAKNSSHLTY